MALPNAPQSRNEKYLAKIAGQEVELPNEPLSREEQYLEYIATHGGGGGGGDYADLTNRPSINGIELLGNKTAGDLGLVAAPIVNLNDGMVSHSTDTSYITVDLDVPLTALKQYSVTLKDPSSNYIETLKVLWNGTTDLTFPGNASTSGTYGLKLLEETVQLFNYGGSWRDIYCTIEETATIATAEDVMMSDGVTSVEDAIDEITDNLTASNDVPFRFGYDQSTGKYGYILNQGGADTVIPFSASGGYNPFTFGECYSYCVNDSVTMTARYTAEYSTKYVFFFIASDAFDAPEINVTVTINGVSKTELVKEMYRDENSYFDVKYICVELEAGDVCVFNTTGTKGNGTSSAIYGTRVTRDFNTGDLIDSDKYSGESTPKYLTSTIEETGSYFLFFFARCSDNNVGFNKLSINDVPYDIFTVLKYNSWSAAIGITYAELQEDDIVKIGGGQWGGYYTSEAFGIISAE